MVSGPVSLVIGPFLFRASRRLIFSIVLKIKLHEINEGRLVGAGC